MGQYETVFIATPILTEAQLTELKSSYEKLITENGGEIVGSEAWGLKKLKYPIKKKSNGYYFVFEYKAEGTFVSKIETEFKRSEDILRFLTVKLDKYAVEFNERRRNGAFNKEKKDA